MARLALGLQNRRDVLRECHLLGRGLLRERSAGQCEECAEGDGASQVELRTRHHLGSSFLLSYSERLYGTAPHGKTRTTQRHLGGPLGPCACRTFVGFPSTKQGKFPPRPLIISLWSGSVNIEDEIYGALYKAARWLGGMIKSSVGTVPINSSDISHNTDARAAGPSHNSAARAGAGVARGPRPGLGSPRITVQPHLQVSAQARAACEAGKVGL
jgi:hypothetical protein